MDSMERFTHLLTMLNEVYRYTRCHKFVYIQRHLLKSLEIDTIYIRHLQMIADVLTPIR